MPPSSSLLSGNTPDHAGLSLEEMSSLYGEEISYDDRSSTDTGGWFWGEARIASLGALATRESAARPGAEKACCFIPIDLCAMALCGRVQQLLLQPRKMQPVEQRR